MSTISSWHIKVAVSVLVGVILFFSATHNVKAASSTAETISDDIINSFLYSVDNSLQEKVKALGADIEKELRIPILFGVEVSELEDSWGDPRGGGRIHKAIDIKAPRGEFIVSPTEAVVTNVGYGPLAGHHVVTANPGGEQFYYAHLERIASGVSPGKVLEEGDLIGYVGNSGNATDASPHLHMTIYYRGVEFNPFPRLTKEFSLSDRVAALTNIINGSDDAFSAALHVIRNQGEFVQEAIDEKLELPSEITFIRENPEVVAEVQLLASDMKSGAKGEGVRALQRLIIKGSSGPHAKALANTGPTGYFGLLTENALIEYQKSAGVVPATGYFGALTRARIVNLLGPPDADGPVAPESAPGTFAETNSSVAKRDLEVGASGADVRWLQNLLIKEGSGPHARALANVGATGYFGPLTKDALAEYQSSNGIVPAQGYFGPITRAHLQ